MGFAAPSDPILLLALVSAATVGALSISLILYMVVLRVSHLRQHRRWQRCIASWQPLVAQCLETVPKQIPHIQRAEETPLLTLWNHAQESVRGEATSRLNAFAREAGLDRAARRLLRKRGLYGRLLAVVTLGHLRDAASWPELQQLAKDPRPLLSLCAARALMLTDVQRALPELLPAFLSRVEWPLARVASMLAEAGPTQVSVPLIEALSSARDTQLARLLRLLDFAHGEMVIPHIDRLLLSARNEGVLLACLKSLHLPHDAAAARKLIQHPSWAVRTQAARALGRIGTRADIPALLHALADPVWWVRYRAAQAVVALPGMGKDELADIRSRLSDRYAVDMLDQALAEGRDK